MTWLPSRHTGATFEWLPVASVHNLDIVRTERGGPADPNRLDGYAYCALNIRPSCVPSCEKWLCPCASIMGPWISSCDYGPPPETIAPEQNHGSAWKPRTQTTMDWLWVRLWSWCFGYSHGIANHSFKPKPGALYYLSLTTHCTPLLWILALS